MAAWPGYSKCGRMGGSSMSSGAGVPQTGATNFREVATGAVTETRISGAHAF